jgi:hypothetical protein
MCDVFLARGSRLDDQPEAAVETRASWILLSTRDKETKRSFNGEERALFEDQSGFMRSPVGVHKLNPNPVEMASFVP